LVPPDNPTPAKSVVAVLTQCSVALVQVDTPSSYLHAVFVAKWAANLGSHACETLTTLPKTVSVMSDLLHYSAALQESLVNSAACLYVAIKSVVVVLTHHAASSALTVVQELLPLV